jgi:hypothetical protein
VLAEDPFVRMGERPASSVAIFEELKQGRVGLVPISLITDQPILPSSSFRSAMLSFMLGHYVVHCRNVWHVIPFRTMLGHAVMNCRDVCHVVPCHAMLGYALIPCCDVCHVAPCHTILGHALIPCCDVCHVFPCRHSLS